MTATASRTFELHRKAYLWVQVFGTGAFAVAGAIAVVSRLTETVERIAMVVVMGSIGTMGIYRGLWTPHTIRWNGDGTVDFCAYASRTTVAATEIQSIEPDKIGGESLVVHTARKKVLLVNQFTGFHEFVTLLKGANPGIKFRGC